MNGDHGPILDKNNIINVRDGESLYQICIKLRRRLSGVPGFQQYLDEMEEREADGLTDPVSSLWQCFRSGMPLLTIYNASDPEEGNLTVNTNRPERAGKEAAFLFIKSCMQKMNIPAADTFTITDLYSDNTTGFVKVTKSVNRVLDILRLSGKLQASTDSEDSREGTEISSNATTVTPPKSLTRRQHILKELVETERQYVHHLQNLQALKKELEEVGALTGDAIHNIFLNLNNLLDFAQRFLIRIEQQNELPESQQNWGRLFVHYKDPFRQYEPFIANQRKCEATCQQEWDKMVQKTKSPFTQQMLANPTILNGFLLKPFQRLTKYPLLLRDLQKQIEDDDLKMDLEKAIAIIQDVLNQADASIDKDQRDDALQDLQERVDDWKQIQISTFGELLLLGTFNVLKDSTARAEEKEYHIYLFSRILIMCKDVNANKMSKTRLANTKPILSSRGKPKMNLKGRIYFTNVISVTPSTSPGNYSLQITWRGDPQVQTFIVKFKNDDTLRKWHTMIMTQQSSCLMENRSRGISDTHLMSMKDANLENPYLQDEDEDYNRLSGTTYGGTDTNGYSEFSMSRNASSTSLRSRSATGGSGGSNPHLSAGRMRVPTGEMGGLSLNTRGLPVSSPQDHPGGSYFSPIDRDTPPGSTVSARSSSQSAFAGYHRGATTPVSAGMYPPESHRNTAPAMARRPDGHTSGNPYVTNGRHRGQNSTGGIQQAPRMRSASSPDVHPMVQQNRKYMSSEHAPSVPPIPAHMTKQMAAPSRSQNNSPNNGPPSRGSTPQQYGLPQGVRPGLPNHGYTYDQSYASERRPTHAPSLSQGRAFSPPVSSPSSDGDTYIPSQLKAKVCFDENYVSMIIASNIHFRSLADRIDAKLARFTNHSIASGSVRLRYRDEDGDFILIDSDEAVHDALLDWRENQLANAANPQNSELLLYAHAVSGEAMVPG